MGDTAAYVLSFDAFHNEMKDPVGKEDVITGFHLSGKFRVVYMDYTGPSRRISCGQHDHRIPDELHLPIDLAHTYLRALQILHHGDIAAEFPDPSADLRMFFAIYFLLTGLHGFHVLIGMFVMLWLIVRSLKGHFGPDYFTPVDMGGLYWHLVDLIWIFVFPLLYLIH